MVSEFITISDMSPFIIVSNTSSSSMSSRSPETAPRSCLGEFSILPMFSFTVTSSESLSEVEA